MKLSVDHMFYAVKHITDHGDTDIYPFPLELIFYKEEIDTVSKALSKIDLHQFSPKSLVESLIPKSKYGFRVAHQAYPSDAIIYTALVCSIIDRVEDARSETRNLRAWSYRKNSGQGSDFFIKNRNFRSWLNIIDSTISFGNYKYVIRTDISDYYMRIYRHRLENVLESLSGDEKVVKRIEAIVKAWRGGQSFGLPVGSNASRLLAEVALHDTDMALMSEDIWHSRYVDDFILLIRDDQSPYAALGFLAQHLSENEGLSLNNQKTTIYTVEEFQEKFSEDEAQDDSSINEWATERLFWATYGNDELEPKALEALLTKDLVKELEEELAKIFWDMGKIRIILHAMRMTLSEEAAEYVRKNIEALIPFSKDVCLFIEHYVKSGSKKFENIASDLTTIILSDLMRPLAGARAWFMELGTRGIVNYGRSELRRLSSLSGTLDTRQYHLLMWRAQDVNFFRRHKAKLNEIQTWAQPTFVFGASCLPRDEYSHWIKSIRSRVEFPLGIEFCDWCLASYGKDPFKTKDNGAREVNPFG